MSDGDWDDEDLDPDDASVYEHLLELEHRNFLSRLEASAFGASLSLDAVAVSRVLCLAVCGIILDLQPRGDREVWIGFQPDPREAHFHPWSGSA